MAGAGFGGPLLICLLKLTLYKKSSAHSLQFGLKYHASSASLRTQITEHIHYNSGWSIMCLQIHAGRKFDSTRTTITWRRPALYYVGEELENLMRTNTQTDREQTHREFKTLGHSNPRGSLGWVGQFQGKRSSTRTRARTGARTKLIGRPPALQELYKVRVGSVFFLCLYVSKCLCSLFSVLCNIMIPLLQKSG